MEVLRTLSREHNESTLLLDQTMKTFFTLARYIDKMQERGQGGGSQAQIWLMVRLKEDGEHTLKELSSKLHVSPPSLCLMLKRLVSEGMVCRREHPEDRRKALYSITPPGIDWIDAKHQDKLAIMGDMIAKLDPETQAKLPAALSAAAAMAHGILENAHE